MLELLDKSRYTEGGFSMKVGIIGGGFGLTVQAPIINIHPKMKVSAVGTMKRHQLPTEMRSGSHAPVHYRNWTEMLNIEEIDLLFVSSIPVYHFEFGKRHQKHCM